jgi:hypothetical protein
MPANNHVFQLKCCDDRHLDPKQMKPGFTVTDATPLENVVDEREV